MELHDALPVGRRAHHGGGLRRGVIFGVLVGALGGLLAACAAPNQGYLTTFTPKKEPSRSLDMNYEGPRANVAVSDFTVKASGAGQFIGDGLREMLTTALFESLRFNVAKRQDLETMTAEQRLSYSKMAAPGSPKLGGQMAVAELLVSGTVTEFEAEASGAGVRGEMHRLPAEAAVEGKKAHVAIDIEVVDAATGFVVAARRIQGSAGSAKATAGSIAGGGLTEMPFSLGVFRNTPVELAIRDCIYRAVIYLTDAVPPKYFTH
jgi:curli biogenesis system outer membrane secretion channel CsgG